MWIIAGILLFSANLRGLFTAVGPLLGTLQDAFGMGASEAGLLIALPLVVFCLVSPLAPRLARGLGLERALFLALGVMAVGIIVRAFGPLWALYLGTAVLGAGIAIGNTLLPSLLKRDFPDQLTKLTAVYAITMGIGSAVASAVVVPLSDAVGWRLSLGAFVILPLASALLWLPQLGRHSDIVRQTTPQAAESVKVWRSPLAWQVTLFFGVNSAVYYAVATWLPSILADAGFTQAMAGTLHGVMQLATALPGLFLAPLVQRTRDQRGIAAALVSLGLVSIVGLCLLPGWAVLWVSGFGFGVGGAFILALAFLGLRTRSADQTARLSGMTQSVGYVLSASAPVLFGALHDKTGSWAPVLAICALLCGLLIILGLAAGRDRSLDEN
ncbi:transporter, major facilitator family protein [Brevundimonas diminuta 470-4]|nr:transporter, major facilitator family protein [Brevundimonas diminuta 470-4]